MMRYLFKKFFEDRSGVTAVEFALIAPILFMLTIGGIAAGNALFVKNLLADAMNVAQRALQINPDLTVPEIRLLIEASFTSINLSNVIIDKSDVSTSLETIVSLELTYPHNLNIPFVGNFDLLLVNDRKIILY